MFSKESQEAGLAQEDKKEGEDDDQTSSDSDGADACKRSSQAKKEGAGQRKLTEEQKKKKHKRDKQRPEKLRKQLFEILLRKRIFLTDRFEKIEKSLIMHGIITGK